MLTQVKEEGERILTDRTNLIHAIGTLTQDFAYSHEVANEKFYIGMISINRSSGNVDILPILTSEYVLCRRKLINQKIEVYGEIRTRNEDGKVHIFIFCNELEKTAGDDLNEITLEGYICKDPINRSTPLGRTITDLLVAVNRRFNKSDYLPCVVWGRTAKKASCYGIGTKVDIKGRLQSRKYTKVVDDSLEERTAIEISVATIDESIGY